MTTDQSTPLFHTVIRHMGHPISDRIALSPQLVVLLGGANLILIQWVLVREMTALLLGTELVVLLVSVSYFAGLSVGYLLSQYIRQRWLVPLTLFTLIIHLTLPIWFRLLVVLLTKGGAYWMAYIILPLLVPFAVSAFYSIFLPLFVDSGTGKLPTLYATEVMGSVAGIGALFLFSSIGIEAIYIIYAVAVCLILFLLHAQRKWIALAAAVSAIWLAIFPAINGWSNARWYEAIYNLAPNSTTLFTAYSAYQKVDVIQEPNGTRHLFLDGLSHFESSEERVNVVLGSVPAALLKPKTALVVGAGVMRTEEILATHGAFTTTVELDPVVVNAATQHFIDFNQMDKLTNRRIVIDDAKHFLANTPERYDLIVGDTPAAYSIQTATLYSSQFFSEVHAHLKPGGVFAVNLTSSFSPDDDISRRIVATLLANFQEVVVVTPASVGWSFAYAGDNLPFDRAAIEAAFRANGEYQFNIFDTQAVRAITGDAKPISLDSLDFVLKTSLDWIGDRLQW